MTKSLLEQLREVTKVVADTGDFESIQRFRPQDSTTNPSLINAAAHLPQYKPLVDQVVAEAVTELGSTAKEAAVAQLAFRRLAVAFGQKILAIIPGRVSTEVDARLSYDRMATIDQAHAIIHEYERLGIGRERILIKIAATWEGIQAARQLEQEKIHCNLTLIFGLHQAIACAEAGVTLISPFVGRILDWYKANQPGDYAGANDPGVKSVRTIYNYLKKFGYQTVVMGASFRNVSEITELAGCDLLTISPKLLTELDAATGTLKRQLDSALASADPIEKIAMTQALFEKMHQENVMAHEKLTEGIQGFSAALAELETLIAAAARKTA